MSWRIWIAVGFVVIAGVSDVVSYFDISVPGVVESVASFVAFLAGPGILAPGAMALAFAIDRPWVFLLPLVIVSLHPALEWAGLHPRFPGDWNILTPSGFVLYIVITLVLWEFNLSLGLTLRIWWERRPPRQSWARKAVPQNRD